MILVRMTPLLGLVLLLSGCGGGVNRQVPEGVWPWAPAEVKFHQLSRFLERDGVEILSLRIEFRDAEGDPVKFPGTVIIEVSPQNTLDESWTFTFDLSDLKTNASFWDHVTSTYRIELEIDWDDPPLPNTEIMVRISADSPETGLLSNSISAWRGGN